MPDIGHVRLRQEVIVAIGNSGGDGGSAVVTSHGVIHMPGNNPEARMAHDAIVKNYAKLQGIALKQKNIIYG